jgi:hypothetical protein
MTHLANNTNEEIGDEEIAQEDKDDCKEIASSESIVHKMIPIGRPSISLYFFCLSASIIVIFQKEIQ